MQRETAALQAEESTCRVIAFPSQCRIGHARRIADQLRRARTNKEADWLLGRALDTHYDQLARAGIGLSRSRSESGEFRALIHSQCIKQNSRWIPALPQSSNSPTGDSAA